MSRDLVPILDAVERALSRLAVQFRGLPNTEAIARIIGKQFQPIADAFADLYWKRSIDTGEGAQLDRIGRIVGEPRGGVDDETYRLYLRAKIRANKSSGGPDQIIAVFQAMFPASPGAPLFIWGGGPASFTLRLEGLVLDPPAAAAAVFFLRFAELAGVRGVLEWRTAADDATFIFDGTPKQGFGDATDPTVGGRLSGAA